MHSRQENLILEHIYGNKEYQRRVLLVACFIWGLLDVISLSLGLLELKPIVKVSDLNRNIIFTGPLSYDYCNEKLYTIDIIEYSKHSLVVYFNIYCNKYLVALIGSCNFFGVLMGTLISPFIVDYYGRKQPITIALIIYSILIFLSTFSPNIYIMLIFIFLCGFFNLISHIAIFLLLNEVTRKEKRAKYSSIIFNSFALFGIIFTWALFYINNWKFVFYLIAVLCIVLSFLTNILIKESPRFLLMNNDHKFKEKMLTRIFNYGKEIEYLQEIKENKEKKRNVSIIDNELKINLIDKTSEDSQICKVYLGKNNIEDQETQETNQDRKKSAINLIKNPNINYIFLIMCFLWFCISGSYYGVLIIAKDIKGNPYRIYSMMYTMEIFSNIIASLMMEHPNLGRKTSLICLFFIANIFLLIKFLPFLNFDNYLGIYYIALRFIISIIYSIIYVYSVESYPTDIRAKGLAFNAVFGRLSSIIVPFLVEILEEKFILFLLIVFSISFGISFFLKETHNRELEQYTK